MARQTESGLPFEPVYGPADLEGWDPAERLGEPGRVPVHPRRLPDDVHGQAVDDAPVRRVRHGRGVQRALPASSSPRARPGCRSPSTCRRRWATTPTTRSPTARSARSASRSTRSTTCAILFGGIPLDEVSTSMTINAPAAVLLLLYQLVAEEQGVPATALTGTIQNDVLKEYIARGTYIYPPAAVAAAHHRHLQLLPRGDPALEHDLDLRLPHGRGRGDARAGDRVHARRRHRVRARRGRVRHGRRRVRAAPRVLLRRPARRCSRRSRSSARPAASGPRVMREEFGAKNPKSLMLRFHTQTAGRPAHRAAARGQPRARRGPGARRGARRHAVAAHQLLRRGDRAADARRRRGSRCAPSRCWPTRPT